MDAQLSLFNSNLKRLGKEVTINGVTVRAIIKEHTNLAIGIDTKHIFIPIAHEVVQGDIIGWNGNKYLVTNEEFSINNVYTKCLMRKLHHTINIKYANTEVWNIPCFIVDNIQTIKSGTVIDIATGSIVITIPYTTTTTLIEHSTRLFAMGRQVWEVVGITNTEEGLIKLYCDKTLGIVGDDKENLVAYNEKSIEGYVPPEPTDPEPEVPTDNYTLTINGESDALTGFTENYTATITNNGVPVTDKVVTWDIINADFTTTPYATIESTDGYNCTIKAGTSKYIGKSFILICSCEELGLETEKTIRIVGF